MVWELIIGQLFVVVMFILIVVHHLQDPYLGRKNIQMKIVSTIFALVVGMFVFDAGLDAQTHWSGKIGGGASTLGNVFRSEERRVGREERRRRPTQRRKH